MADQQHLITPPHDKVYWWWEEACKQPPSSFYEKLDYVAAKAAELGWQERDASVPSELQKARDEELEACCEWLLRNGWAPSINRLRAARRPKPPSLAEGPTDEEVDAWVDQQGFIRGHGDHPCGFWIDDGDAGALVRAALARWGKQSIPLIIMTDQHPITPPPELVAQWSLGRRYSWNYIATQAARWGADTELAACCEWIADNSLHHAESDLLNDLHAARRPKPQSLAKEAQKALDHLLRHSRTQLGSETIRRALKRLQELEGQA